MVSAFVAFFASMAGIMALFMLKSWERRAARVLAPTFRDALDARALQLKDLLAAARMDLAKLPPAGLRLTRFLVHEAALGLAVVARASERQLHRLADFVSHKHRFEKRETQSEFLKKVAEHKGNEGSSEDLM